MSSVAPSGELTPAPVRGAAPRSVGGCMGMVSRPRGRTTKHRSSRSLRAVRPTGIETASCWDKHRPRSPETLHILGKHKPAETPPGGLGRLLKSSRQVSTTKSDRPRTDEGVVDVLLRRLRSKMNPAKGSQEALDASGGRSRGCQRGCSARDSDRSTEADRSRPSRSLGTSESEGCPSRASSPGRG